jgi:hypothetical protein
VRETQSIPVPEVGLERKVGEPLENLVRCPDGVGDEVKL